MSFSTTVPFLTSTSTRPQNYVTILYPGFQLLDVTGPLDVLSTLNKRTEGVSITHTYAAETLDPVSVAPKAPHGASWKFAPCAELPDSKAGKGLGGMGFNPKTSPDITFDHVLESLERNDGKIPLGDDGEEMGEIDVLIIPGGIGTRMTRVDSETGEDLGLNVLPCIEFVHKICKFVRCALLTVCTGSFILSQTGLLDGRRACTNVRAFPWVASRRGQVIWQEKRRWVRSEAIVRDIHDVRNVELRDRCYALGGHLEMWSSAGVSAGIDLSLHWVAAVYGTQVAREAAMKIEYDWKEQVGEGEVDPFYKSYVDSLAASVKPPASAQGGKGPRQSEGLLQAREVLDLSPESVGEVSQQSDFSHEMHHQTVIVDSTNTKPSIPCLTCANEDAHNSLLQRGLHQLRLMLGITSVHRSVANTVNQNLRHCRFSDIQNGTEDSSSSSDESQERRHHDNDDDDDSDDDDGNDDGNHCIGVAAEYPPNLSHAALTRLVNSAVPDGVVEAETAHSDTSDNSPHMWTDTEAYHTEDTVDCEHIVRRRVLVVDTGLDAWMTFDAPSVVSDITWTDGSWIEDDSDDTESTTHSEADRAHEARRIAMLEWIGREDAAMHARERGDEHSATSRNTPEVRDVHNSNNNPGSPEAIGHHQSSAVDRPEEDYRREDRAPDNENAAHQQQTLTETPSNASEPSITNSHARQRIDPSRSSSSSNSESSTTTSTSNSDDAQNDEEDPRLVENIARIPRELEALIDSDDEHELNGSLSPGDKPLPEQHTVDDHRERENSLQSEDKLHSHRDLTRAEPGPYQPLHSSSETEPEPCNIISNANVGVSNTSSNEAPLLAYDVSNDAKLESNADLSDREDDGWSQDPGSSASLHTARTVTVRRVGPWSNRFWE